MGRRRSVSLPVGSKRKKILGTIVVRKKYLGGYQFPSSKKCLETIYRKVFFNLVLDLFYRNEGWRRILSILVGSEREGLYDLRVLRKKYSGGCQIRSSKSSL